LKKYTTELGDKRIPLKEYLLLYLLMNRKVREQIVKQLIKEE
jgi:hypothetical protein